MARGKSERSRHEKKRHEKPTVLIICEGETELLYFRDIKRRYRAMWMEPHHPHCNDPKGLVSAAMRKRKELVRKGLKVETWVVFDAESYAEQEARGYAEAIGSAAKNNIQVANSSPSFEYWILLHYVPGIQVIEPREAEKELAKEGRIPSYRKPDLPYDELWEKYLNGTPSAFARKGREAARLEKIDPRMARPVTYVDELVDRLTEIAK